MTTNEEVKQRTVSELLQLDTYQGMTDEEIMSIINFYQQQSYTEGKAAGFSEGSLSALDKIQSMTSDALSNAEAAFNNAINSTVKLESV